MRLPEPRREPCAAGALVSRIAGLVKADAEKRRVGVRVEILEPLTDIPMDRAQMEQVLLNVLKNALEAIGTGRNGDAPRRAAGRAARPRRRGLGARASLPRRSDQLFRPFFSTKENGQGLGLTLVQEVLTRHGFPFALESNPGEPTRFTVVLGSG